MSELDRLLDEIRDLEPEELPRDETQRRVEQAAMTGRARHRAWVRRRVLLSCGAGAALAAAAVLLFLHQPPPTALPPAPATPSIPVAEATPVVAPVQGEPSRTDLELPTGDRLLAAEGARFRVELATSRERRIRLTSGSMLFDVRRLPGGRFRVTTPGADVLVLGTVFTVTTGDEGTVVRVYEGRVSVRDRSGARVLRAGQHADIGTPTASPDPLAPEAERAAARRASEPEARARPLHRPAPHRPTHSASAPEPPTGPASDDPALDDGASEDPSSEDPAEAATPTVEAITPREAHGWIVNGQGQRALDEARRHVDGGDLDPWLMVEADALRSLGRRQEAADAYARAASALPSPRAEQAGFASARLRPAPELALRALDAGHVTAPGSPLRERGLALRADLLGRLGRLEAQRDIAREYLRSYPQGSRAESMTELVHATRHP